MLLGVNEVTFPCFCVFLDDLLVRRLGDKAVSFNGYEMKNKAIMFTE